MTEEHQHQEHQHQKPKGSGVVEISKSTLWMIISGILGILLVVSVFTQGFGIVRENSGGYIAQPSPGPSPSPSGIPPGIAVVNAKELADDDPYTGNKDAPLTIIEFSDFQCPFCQRFHDQAYGQIKKEYIDAGKVKFVYRDFPLESIHPYARKAAEAGECADEQGKFWEYHGKLFENQQVWSGAGESEFKKYAQDLKLDSEKFNTCLDSGKYANEVSKDLADGARSGVQGTPFFVVGSTPLSGAQPFASFKAAIDFELGK
ncbi:MAG TPA: DsbA family protein [Candidatus Nanoarchaeia archaeon]|nr:DsbA family protein [Candidatus Nanoarchaeia archaeon]